MKKIIFAALVSSLFAIGAMAQSTSVIVSAGYQGAKITGSNDAKMVSGARAGVAVDIPVLNSGTMQLTVQPGLNFSMKGYKFGGENTNVVSNLYYIDLPILANLRFDVDSRLSAFVNAGPYLGYGVGGKASGKFLGVDLGTDTSNPFKKTTVFGNEVSKLNAFDWGLQVGAGVEYSRIMLGVGTQVGLYDITPGKNVSNKNSSFFVTLGYRF